MTTYQRLLGVLGLSFLGALANCADDPDGIPPIEVGEPLQAEAEHTFKSSKLVQFGTLDQLNRGVLDGSGRVSSVAFAGNFGVGTFNALDGEMIVLNGIVYQFTADGVLRVAPPSLSTPFAAVTRFSTERTFNPPGPLADYPALQGFLTTSLPNANMPYAIKVKGTFTSIKTRAPRAQVKPYPTLADAVKTQVTFDFANITGTMVGFRLPGYFGTVNAAGYHFHFVSDDLSTGGHVLEVSPGSVVVQSCTITESEVKLQDED